MLVDGWLASLACLVFGVYSIRLSEWEINWVLDGPAPACMVGISCQMAITLRGIGCYGWRLGDGEYLAFHIAFCVEARPAKCAVAKMRFYVISKLEKTLPLLDGSIGPNV